MKRMHNHFRRKDRNYCDWCQKCERHEFQHYNFGGPMLRMDLWKRIAKDKLDGYMCLECMRKLLGRPFTLWDLAKPWWFYELLTGCPRPEPWRRRQI